MPCPGGGRCSRARWGPGCQRCAVAVRSARDVRTGAGRPARIGITLIVAHGHAEPESRVQLKVPRSSAAILFGKQGRILRQPYPVDIVETRARCVRVKEQRWLIVTNVILAAARILALLRAQDSTRFVAFEERCMRGRSPRRRTALQQESRTEQSSTRPRMRAHKRYLPTVSTLFGVPVPSLSLPGRTTPAEMRIVRVRSVVASGNISAGTHKPAWLTPVALNSSLESPDRTVAPKLALRRVFPSALERHFQ
jgi:hypothetical protein